MCVKGSISPAFYSSLCASRFRSFWCKAQSIIVGHNFKYFTQVVLDAIQMVKMNGIYLCFVPYEINTFQFHQNFMSSFFANILLPKNYKHKLKAQKSWAKAARKMLVKLTHGYFHLTERRGCFGHSNDSRGRNFTRQIHGHVQRTFQSKSQTTFNGP